MRGMCFAFGFTDGSSSITPSTFVPMKTALGLKCSVRYFTIVSPLRIDADFVSSIHTSP